MTWVVYHHCDCSKSRLALDFLHERKIDFTIRDYISNPLSKDEILDLQRFLGIPIIGLVRTGANDVLQVRSMKEDQQERLVPFIDQVIVEVDLKTRKLIIDWGLDY